MTKQDEIREGIEIEFIKYMMRQGMMLEAPKELSLNIIQKLHSQGVVIKVGEELDGVYVVEHGEYEQRCLDGVYESFDSAVDGIKATYSDPYKVTWEQIDEGLIGHFERVLHYSMEHTAVYDITKYPFRVGYVAVEPLVELT